MIDAKELRIGNLITYDGKVIEVEGVVRNTIYHKGGFDSNTGASYQPFKPIPLTEQWLIDFGWRYYNGRSSGDLTMDTPCRLDVDFIEGRMMVKSHYHGYEFYKDLNIDYVHQLQNIYFALTGEELQL